jgi:hypothetical protein
VTENVFITNEGPVLDLEIRQNLAISFDVAIKDSSGNPITDIVTAQLQINDPDGNRLLFLSSEVGGGGITIASNVISVTISHERTKALAEGRNVYALTRTDSFSVVRQVMHGTALVLPEIVVSPNVVVQVVNDSIEVSEGLVKKVN